MWHHHFSSDDEIPEEPEGSEEEIVERTPFTHMDQILHLGDIQKTIDVHNMAEWDEHQRVDKQFYLDSDDKKNTIPPLMKRFIRTFKDYPQGRGDRSNVISQTD